MSCVINKNSSVEDVFDKFADMVYRIALLRTGRKNDAEDVVQEVFMRYIDNKEKIESAKIENITHEEYIKAWLIKVTINCSKSLVTSSWFKKTVTDDDIISSVASEDTAEKSEVYYAVQALPMKYRTAIHLYYYEGYSTQEIASITGEKETTIRSHLHRARELLRKEFGIKDVQG